MKKNLGKVDRGTRIVVGLVIGAAGIYFKSWWGLIGLLPILTGLVGTCYLYMPFRFLFHRPRKA